MLVELIAPLSPLAHGSGDADLMLFDFALSVASGLFLLGRRAEARQAGTRGDAERQNDA